MSGWNFSIRSWSIARNKGLKRPPILLNRTGHEPTAWSLRMLGEHIENARQLHQTCYLRTAKQDWDWAVPGQSTSLLLVHAPVRIIYQFVVAQCCWYQLQQSICRSVCWTCLDVVHWLERKLSQIRFPHHHKLGWETEMSIGFDLLLHDQVLPGVYPPGSAQGLKKCRKASDGG